MSEILEVTNYIKDLEEVGLPQLQEALSRMLKCRVIPLKLAVKVDYRKENYLEIYSDDLKDLLGDTLVHVLFEEITLNGTGNAHRQVISGDNPEGEIVLFFNFDLHYTFPSGGRNGQSFKPTKWIFWRVSEKRWYVGSLEEPLDNI